MKLQFALVSVLFSATLATTSFAADSSVYSDQTVGRKREALFKRMAEELSPAIKTFSRDVYVYHWGQCQYQATGSKKDLTANDSNALQSVQRLILWNYRKDKNQGGMLGTSYYVSTDPIATKGFGDCLSETRLPAKAKFMDERRPIRFSDELETLLRSEGCAWSRNLTDMLGHSNTNPCREIATQFLLALRVSAVSYQYYASRSNTCLNFEHFSAFILVNPSLAQEKYTKVFTPMDRPKDGADDDRARIKAVAKTFGSASMFWPKRNWFFGNLKSSNIDADQWVKDHLFGCDPTKYPEDAFVDPTLKQPVQELDFDAKIPTWGVLPPIGDEATDCCKTANADLQNDINKAITAMDPALNAILSP